MINDDFSAIKVIDFSYSTPLRKESRKYFPEIL
jgi:hypothetical protein